MPHLYYNTVTFQTQICDRPLEDPNLVEVPNLPPGSGYDYVDGDWVKREGEVINPMTLSNCSDHPTTNPREGETYFYRNGNSFFYKDSQGVISELVGGDGVTNSPPTIDAIEPTSTLTNSIRIFTLLGSRYSLATRIFVIRDLETEEIAASKITFLNGGTIQFELSAGAIAESVAIKVDNGAGEVVLDNAIAIQGTQWQFLGTSGISFTHGNEPGRDIRYAPDMTLYQEADGIWFSGRSVFSSFVMFEGMQWERSSKRTLKVIFSFVAGNEDNMMLGLAQPDLDEAADSFTSLADFQFFIFPHKIGAIVSDNFWTGIQKSFTTNFHRVEIESNGDAGAKYRFYDLPDIDAESWDNTDVLIYERVIPDHYLPNSDYILPFVTAYDGNGARIVAIQIG